MPAKMKRPSGVLVVARARPVAVLRSASVTPGSAPPEVSDAVPAMVADVCAAAADAVRTTKQSERKAFMAIWLLYRQEKRRAARGRKDTDPWDDFRPHFTSPRPPFAPRRSPRAAVSRPPHPAGSAEADQAAAGQCAGIS